MAAAAIFSAVGSIASIGGSVMSAVGSSQKGEADKQLAEYNARVADGNANLARQTATERERLVRIDGRKALGSMRAAYGASGVDMSQGGSPLDVLEESARNSELDALTVRHAGEVKARAFENEALVYRKRGATAQALGYSEAAGYAVQGLGKAASMVKG